MNYKRLADVAGTKEPIYGPSAIRSLAEQAKETPYTELKKDDMKWVAMNSTSVETFTFYLMGDDGHTGFVQVIHSNVAYALHTSLLCFESSPNLESIQSFAKSLVGVTAASVRRPSSTPRSFTPTPPRKLCGAPRSSRMSTLARTSTTFMPKTAPLSCQRMASPTQSSP